MNLPVITAIALVTLSFTASAQDAAKPSSRPADVEETRWVPLGEAFGFVITQDIKLPKVYNKDGKLQKLAPANPPPVTGYFVIRRERIWCRVNVENVPVPSLAPSR